ncbi:MAG: Zinc-type alcohol dehydrogenase-like protein [Luteibacter sp.]|uniref:NADP-dependent oxidoreductase n=1 Tax=Luteibacter sp. TaxID=1886636 RepID=UPI00137E11CB|nr:NADP-dependent oxidoreductase [Luteibacter sp.]KAF1004954.1 MAG: Zinc-type alcohol dehydrogenase-like protein [Luteibacter sp.]
MKAVVINAYGDNDVVQYLDIDRPEPRDGQIRIKVLAAGVNPVDWKIRNGAGERMGMTLPIHLGGEVAGTVDALGEGVTRFAEGDAVYGIIPSGGFAEYAIASATDMAPMPGRLSFTEAAAVPLGALTAWQALFGLAQLSPGQRLLVTSGAGGVGSLAVQMAKAKGVHVTAMASTRNEDYVRGLGADVFIDYTRHDFTQVANDMDVVFDTVGGETFGRAFACVKSGGFLVTAVAFPTDEGERHGVRTARVVCKPDAGQLASITDLVEDGAVIPRVGTVLPLKDIKQALALSETGRARGKIVLTIGE